MFKDWFAKLNQNLRTILVTGIVVILLIVLLQGVYGVVRSIRNEEFKKTSNLQNNNMQNTNNNAQNTNVQGNNTQNNNLSSNLNFADTNMKKEEENVIEQFVDYCNNGKANEAYKMISEDCKKAIFPSIEDFKKNYLQFIFKEKRTAKIQESMYGTKVYQLTYYANLLSSGGSSNSETMQDYVYFTEENGETKLNLNQFLMTEKINKVGQTAEVYATVTKKTTYVEYEEYQIQLTNKTEQTILLSSRKDGNKTVNLVDENDVQYSSNIDEESSAVLVIMPHETSILTIKFNKIYNLERGASKRIQFLDIVTNYEEYMKGKEAKLARLDIWL